MKRVFALSLIPITAMLALGSIGCSDDDDPITPTTVDEFALASGLGDVYFTSYVNANGGGVNVTADVVYATLTDGNSSNDPYILDWRAPDHFALGHIDGAHNVSLANFGDVLSSIPMDATVLNVCYTGQSASHATSYMNMLGIAAQNLKFGMCGWTNDATVNLGKWEAAVSDEYATWLSTVTVTPTQVYEFPTLDTGKSTPVEILRDAAIENLTTTGFAGMSVADLYAEIEVNDNADDYFVVNYFADAQYNAGHIPGAYQFVPKASLGADQMLKYLPTDKTIVVYCFTGQTSSQVVAYLNAMGYDAKSLLYGVNAICNSNDDICTTKFHGPNQDYPVVQ